MKEIDTRKLCEVNDVLYKINRNGISGPTEVIVTSAKQISLGHYAYKHNENERYSFFHRNIGHSLFKTKEEAEKELDKIRKCALKRKLMKEYEAKLNKEIGIENHFIIK